MYYVCGILLIVTSTFSMVKICEVKPTINMRDVRYVCDLIWTQSSIYDLMISVLCVAQCIVCDKVVGSVFPISEKLCECSSIVVSVFQIFIR